MAHPPAVGTSIGDSLLQLNLSSEPIVTYERVRARVWVWPNAPALLQGLKQHASGASYHNSLAAAAHVMPPRGSSSDAVLLRLASGLCAVTRSRAGPSGVRRPCSQLRSVGTLTPSSTARATFAYSSSLARVVLGDAA